MAKKKTTKIAQKPVQEEVVGLPQNIIRIGEHVEEDKNIYISQQAYKKIHSFTKDKTVNESGGILVGDVLFELGKTNILISDFIEAKYCEGTPTTLTFTHESWEYIHKEMVKFPGKKIIGWIHTHPNFGIFLSEYDKFIQENFFKEDYEVAYVVDPIQNIEGFYFWINGKIERCKGFYIYDKTGKEISIDSYNERKEEKSVAKSSSQLLYLTIALAAAVIVLLFAFAKNTSEIKELRKGITTLQNQQESIVESANKSLSNMRATIESLTDEINALKENDAIQDSNISLGESNLDSLVTYINDWIETQKSGEDATTDDGNDAGNMGDNDVSDNEIESDMTETEESGDL